MYLTPSDIKVIHRWVMKTSSFVVTTAGIILLFYNVTNGFLCLIFGELIDLPIRMKKQ